MFTFDFEANLKLLNEKLKLIDLYKKENEHLKTQINELNNNVSKMVKYSRRKKVEIQGVPESNNEFFFDIIVEIGKKFGVNCDYLKSTHVIKSPSAVKIASDPLLLNSTPG